MKLWFYRFFIIPAITVIDRNDNKLKLYVYMNYVNSYGKTQLSLITTTTTNQFTNHSKICVIDDRYRQVMSIVLICMYQHWLQYRIYVITAEYLLFMKSLFSRNNSERRHLFESRTNLSLMLSIS